MRYGAVCVCVCGVWCVGGSMWARRVPPSLATARLPPRTEPTQQRTLNTRNRTGPRRERKRERRVAGRTPERSLPRRDPPEPPGPKPGLHSLRERQLAGTAEGSLSRRHSTPEPPGPKPALHSRQERRLAGAAEGSLPRFDSTPEPPGPEPALHSHHWGGRSERGRSFFQRRLTPEPSAATAEAQIGREAKWAGPALARSALKRGPPSSLRAQVDQMPNATHAASAQPPAASRRGERRATGHRPLPTTACLSEAGAGRQNKNKPNLGACGLACCRCC